MAFQRFSAIRRFSALVVRALQPLIPHTVSGIRNGREDGKPHAGLRVADRRAGRLRRTGMCSTSISLSFRFTVFSDVQCTLSGLDGKFEIEVGTTLEKCYD